MDNSRISATCTDFIRHCQLCDVALSSSTTSLSHMAGKKHKKREELEQARKNLQSRSVFLYGYPTKTVSKSDILTFFSEKFGPVQSLTVDDEKCTWAIVEFYSEAVVKEILRTKKFEINGQKVAAKLRLLTSQNSDIPKAGSTRESENSENVRLDFLVDLDEISDFSIADQTDFDRMKNLAKKLKISAENLSQRQELCLNLEKTLQQFFSFDFCIKLFGSSVNGFGCLQSDIDMTMIFDRSADFLRPVQSTRSAAMLINCHANELSGDQSIKLAEFEHMKIHEQYAMLRKLLASNKCTSEIDYIKGIRCPLLKFVYTTASEKTKFRCEFCINNRLGVNNSNYLACLARFFPNLVILGHTLRYLAHVRHCVDTSVHSLNNYTLLLMFFTYLQTLHLLPTVGKKFEGEFEMDEEFEKNAEFFDGWDCRWTSDNFGLYDNEKIDSAVFDRCLNFLSSTNWSKVVFLPRYGKIVSVDEFLRHNLSEIEEKMFFAEKNRKSEKQITTAHFLFRFSKLNVQDPFVLNHNPAAKVAPVLLKSLKNAAKFRATLAKNLPFFEHLKQPVSIEISDNKNDSNRLGFDEQVGGKATFSLMVHPTDEDFLSLGLQWRLNFRQNFVDSVFKNVRRLLTEFLLIELEEAENDATGSDLEKCVEMGECSPLAKKRKIDKSLLEADFLEKCQIFDCSAFAPTWTCRNAKKFMGESAFLRITDKIQREIEISRRIFENYTKSQQQNLTVIQKPIQPEFSENSQSFNDAERCENLEENFAHENRETFLNCSKFQPRKSPLLNFRLVMTSYSGLDHVMSQDYGVSVNFQCFEPRMHKTFKLCCEFFQSYFRKWRCELCKEE